MTDEERRIGAMRSLGMSEEEIKDVLDYDKRIDKNEKGLGELSKEQKKVEKDMRQAERKKPTNYTFTKRERKANLDKRGLIEILSKAVEKSAADEGSVEVTNIEREFTFAVNGVKYKVVLSAPRK